jgi:uncharacterized protein YggE
MYKRWSIRVLACAAAALLMAVVALAQAGLATFPVRAQGDTPQGTITVVGEGKVKIKPDVAQVSMGVEAVKPTVKEASDDVVRVMDALLAVLKQHAIEDKDTQTSGFSVWLDRPYNPDGTQGAAVYHVSNQMNVTVRNLEKLGDVLDAAMAAGANNIYGVTFNLADTSQAETEARREAIEDARNKAAELAQMTGLVLGDVISVSEVIGAAGGGTYYPSAVNQTAMGVGGGGPSIAPGQLEITVQLQVVYGTVQ